MHFLFKVKENKMLCNFHTLDFIDCSLVIAVRISAVVAADMILAHAAAQFPSFATRSRHGQRNALSCKQIVYNVGEHETGCVSMCSDPEGEDEMSFCGHSPACG